MRQIMENPRYKGKHVVIAGGKVFTARTGEGASKILKKAREKYPQQIPQVTYIPKADTLILESLFSSFMQSKTWQVGKKHSRWFFRSGRGAAIARQT